MDYKEAYARYTAGEKRVDELYHLIATQCGISDSALWVLYCLADPETPHTQNDIAKNMGVPKQTVNSAVARLARDGYVYLEQMAVARNNKRLGLTEKGLIFFTEHIIPVLEAEERAFNRLSEAERELYLSIGEKHNGYLLEELGALLKPAGEQRRL